MSPSRKAASRGVSLIEAVVALAVMGFGMLGVAALQGSLRYNSDVARQRAEAARLGGEAIEFLRSYSVVNAAAGKMAYASIVTGTPLLPGNIVGTNATYNRTVQVFDTAAQNRKTVQVVVTWTDRTNVQQEVRFSTEIHRSPPELAASLIIPGTGTVTQNPGGRDPTIPRTATPNVDGTSSFTPPGSSEVWVFNNTTGMIDKVCNPGCTTTYGRLLAGYIAFATSSSPVTWVDSEGPADNALPGFTAVPPQAGVLVTQTLPLAPPLAPSCFYEQLPGAPQPTKVIAYYCAVFVSAASGGGSRWSGTNNLNDFTVLPVPPVLPLAGSIADASATAFRVCRYTSVQDNTAVVGSGTPALTNSDHPFAYAAVDRNLVNQNFLVVRAGDGTTPNTCPDDQPTTPLVNGRTWHHQPPT